MFSALSLFSLLAGCSQDGRGGDPAVEAAFVGSQQCVQCHTREYQLWRNSHHDLAMQPANEETVLANFENTTFTYNGITSTFSKRGGRFFARTDGPDGQLTDYPISYTFGVEPLQQYLVEFSGGRYQALSIGWDTRPADQGGQRWFHLYPDEKIDHRDILHWTGPYQTWNHMCAECHSTNLQKNYRPEEDRYQTQWSEMDVACEACHGPASRHLDWAEAAQREQPWEDEKKGLVLQYENKDTAHWSFDEGSPIARRSQPRRSDSELENCARCHSRRSVIHDDYIHGRPLMDTHRPSVLEEVLYFADGQIQDEVYVYGSFLQSKMYREGVSCSDCHDPHSLELYSSGDGVCSGCHLRETFATSEHHFHPPESSGANCLGCHMPVRNYMVVDPRRDHSFRIPRPDLSVKLDTPNACNSCHSGETVQWAVETVEKWYGSGTGREPHYGEVLHSGRNGLPGAGPALARLADDPEAAAIVRASALPLLSRYLSRETLPAIQNSLSSSDPLIRTLALSVLQAFAPQDRASLAAPLLKDSVRAVRVEAARVLAAVPDQHWNEEQRAQLQRALSEYQHTQAINSDRVESHLNLGLLHAERGDMEEAENSYRRAIKMVSGHPAAYVNLADLYRLQGRDEEGEVLLRQALEIAPDHGDVNYALGLLLVRRKNLSEALSFLGRAIQLRPRDPHYSYVLAVALQADGQLDRALEVLAASHRQHPEDLEILGALVAYNRQKGDIESAIVYTRKLQALAPQDPGVRQLLRELQTQLR